MKYVSFHMHDKNNKWFMSVDVPAKADRSEKMELCKYLGLNKLPKNTLVVSYIEENW